MKVAEHRRLTPLLIAVCVLALAALAALALGFGRHLHWGAPGNVPARLPTAQETTTLPAALPLQHYADVWQRPLFNTDRRPAPTAFGDDDGDASLGDLELTGIIITPTLRIAMLHNRKTGAEVRVREGSGVANGRWTLQSLAPRSATFNGDGGRTVLPLKVAAHIDRSSPAATETPAATPDASASGGVRQVQAAPRTVAAPVGLPRMNLQPSNAIHSLTPEQIKAGNDQKARMKALRKRLDDQRHQRESAVHDGDH